MKQIRNNIIPFPGFRAINLFGLLFVRKSARIDDVLIRHEQIHTRQMIEITLIALILTLPFLFTIWWLPILSFFTYYLWYVVEWFIHLARIKDTHKAYRKICFEQEAYENQDVDWYLRKRRLFNFINYM